MIYHINALFVTMDCILHSNLQLTWHLQEILSTASLFTLACLEGSSLSSSPLIESFESSCQGELLYAQLV